MVVGGVPIGGVSLRHAVHTRLMTNMTTEMFAIPTRTASSFSSSAYCICCIILVQGLLKNSHTHTVN